MSLNKITGGLKAFRVRKSCRYVEKTVSKWSIKIRLEEQSFAEKYKMSSLVISNPATGAVKIQSCRRRVALRRQSTVQV